LVYFFSLVIFIAMDLNKFFSHFIDNPSSTSKDELITSYSDFYNNPIFKLGMFKKLVFNHVNFNKKMLFSLLNSVSGENDKESLKIKEISEIMIYNKAYSHLEEVDLKAEDNQNYIRQASDEELLTACKLAIRFFEEREEYEKCAKIKILEDLVTSFIK